MFGMKVGVPEENTNKQVGAHTACIPQTVGVLGDFAIGMFQVSEVSK
jgi:hypothetical protein